MKDKRREDKGCTTSYSGCIKYDGPDIPCLGLRDGDYINHVIASIVDQICNLGTPLNLSTVSVQCLLDNFTGLNEPLSKTVATYLQLLIDNQCTIKELIDAIVARIDGITAPPPLILNLKCLSVTDSQGNTTYTIESVLQALINEVCAHRLRLSTIDGQILVLQGQITTLQGNTYTEPQVSSCAYTGTKSLSQAFTFLSNDYCTYKPRVGTVSQITTAISRQPSGLNTEFAADANFVQIPSSLADTDNNQWLVIGKLLDRIGAIEDCCKSDCSDIKIGWQVNDNEDGDGVTLDFSGDYGNNIPTTFTDCGSTVTFVDKNKKRKTYVLRLKQEYTSVEFDLSMLDLTGLITIKVCAQLCNGNQQCCKCEESEHNVVSGTCNVCDVTISGTSGSVSIVYTHNSNITTITAVVGEVVYIPKDAIDINYSTISGDATPDTTCLTITQASIMCYEFRMEETNGGNSTGNILFFDAVYTGIMLGGIQYSFASTVPYSNVSSLSQAINTLQSLTNKVKARCYANEGVFVSKIRVEVSANYGIPYLMIDNNTVATNTTVTKLLVPGIPVTEGLCDCSGYITSNGS